jgi:dynein light intermediate chain
MSSTAPSATSSLIKFDPPYVVSSKKAVLQLPLPRLDGKPLSTEELLNSMIPPRTWNTAEGTLMAQNASPAPATKTDVLMLQEQLDLRLKQRAARETGLCPIRDELYSQCFGMCRGSSWRY